MTLSSFTNLLAVLLVIKCCQCKEIAMDADLQAESFTGNYCCTNKFATARWIAKCPTFGTKKKCTSKTGPKDIVEYCAWKSCSDIGYCDWNGITQGATGSVEKMCKRQTNRASCVNKIYAGSQVCQWTYGYPPDGFTDILDDDDEEERNEDKSLFMSMNDQSVNNNDNTYIQGVTYGALSAIIGMCIGIGLYKRCNKSDYKELDNTDNTPLLII